MATVEEIIVRLRFEAKQSMKNLNKSGMLTKKLGRVSQKAKNELKKLSQAQKSLGIITKQTQRQFAGWAMSMMFFGMAIKRVFDGIWKAGQKTFQEIAHSVEGTVTQFDFLNGAIDILKYTIGSALNSVLEPLMPIIWKIVEATSDWIMENEKLFGWLVIIGSAIGGVMMSFGIMKLGIDGIQNAFALLKPAISGFTTALSGISAGTMLVLLGIVLLFVAAWKTNLGNIQGFFEDTFGIISTAIEETFKGVFDFFKNIWAALIAFMNGDWDEAMDYLREAIGGLFKTILKLGVYLSHAMRNVWIFIANTAIDIIGGAIRGILSQMKEVLEGFGISTSLIDKARSKIKSLQSDLQIDYISSEDSQNSNEMKLAEMIGGGENIYNIVNNFINPSGDEIASEVKRRSNPSTV